MNFAVELEAVRRIGDLRCQEISQGLGQIPASKHILATGRTAEIVVIERPVGLVRGTIGPELEVLIGAETLVTVTDIAS